jgi:hypothetical protein
MSRGCNAKSRQGAFAACGPPRRVAILPMP